MCDTFVALPSVTKDGSVLFGKNSDREPNEAQLLEYHPGGPPPRGDAGEQRCTYISIPRAKENLATLLCRPFWMWGAEMGANEKGVVIGNEAVFTREPHEKAGALTGMDLLRLALERASSAPGAMEVIVQLLSDHGQGGVCGYEDKNMRYHNSFIIADPGEAWVLETAGRLWAALKVKDFYAISNGLTIGEDFDRCHPDLIETARKRGLLKKGKNFHFARCFSDWFFTTFSMCRNRGARSLHLMEKRRGDMDVSYAFRILRDHGVEPYEPDSHVFMNAICAHAANKLARNASTTGSLAAHLKPGCATFWATGTSGPCTGIFKPVWFEGGVLPDGGLAPAGADDPDSLWRRHEGLHRLVLEDYQSRLAAYREERDLLEASFLEKAPDSREGSRFDLSSEAFRKAGEATDRWIDMVKARPVKRAPGFFFRRYWKRQNIKQQQQVKKHQI
ncbi:MAG: hypothetical protein GY859_39615 [Desulfobacterales bacterium]|nr:hypothetical protein [Desulfobacterales bacterium]